MESNTNLQKAFLKGMLLFIHIPLIVVLFFSIYVKQDPLFTGFAFFLTLFASTLAFMLFYSINIRKNKERHTEWVEYKGNHTGLNHPLNQKESDPTHSRNSLNKTLESYRKKNEFKEVLLGILSHDIRGSVTKIKSVSEFAHELDEDELTAVWADLSLTSGRLLNLLDTVLLIMRIEDSENLNRMSKPYDILTLTESSVSSLQTEIHEKKLRIYVKTTTDFEKRRSALKTAGVPGLIEQVLINLLSNSIKFSHRGSKIDIELGFDNIANHLVISFKDYGMGFEENQASSLFERFTNFSRNGTEGEKSVGLGLYLSQQITAFHGGYIEAHSKGSGMGAIFKIHLPAGRLIEQNSISKVSTQQDIRIKRKNEHSYTSPRRKPYQLEGVL
ncbi:MAG: HAMP domain-containing histidine kinase [Balneolales bacterium]|nr:HAMP domain-containing histidine kinase [Balneolales bacterium]